MTVTQIIRALVKNFIDKMIKKISLEQAAEFVIKYYEIKIL